MAPKQSPEDRRDAILEAAIGVFAQHGFDAATTDAIARAAGLSKGGLYWHFRSKDDILAALLEQFFNQELAVLESGLAERELELATLQKALHAFENRSKAELDPRYEELATLQQKIGELQRRLEPVKKQSAAKDDKVATPPKTPEVPRKKRNRPAFPEKRAEAARKLAAFSPAETLKRLYRDVAKAVHPDMADDDLER